MTAAGNWRKSILERIGDDKKTFLMNFMFGITASVPFRSVPKGLDFSGMLKSLFSSSAIVILFYFLLMIFLCVIYTNFVEEKFSKTESKKIYATELMAFISVIVFFFTISLFSMGMRQRMILTGIFAAFYFGFFSALGFAIAGLKNFYKERAITKK